MAATPRQPFWRRRLLPAVAGVVGANLVVLLAYTLPRSWRLRSVSARAVSLREDVERERAKTAERRRRLDTIASNTRDVDRFYREWVPSREEGLVPMLQEIEAMAREPGLSAGHRGYAREPVKGTPLVRVMITVPLSGTYGQLVGFLEKVEKGKRFITVDRVAIRRNIGERGGEAQLAVELSGYFREGRTVPDENAGG